MRDDEATRRIEGAEFGDPPRPEAVVRLELEDLMERGVTPGVRAEAQRLREVYGFLGVKEAWVLEQVELLEEQAATGENQKP